LPEDESEDCDCEQDDDLDDALEGLFELIDVDDSEGGEYQEVEGGQHEEEVND
jgi:hypothetical protein